MRLPSGSLQRWAIIIPLCAVALCMTPFLLRVVGFRALSMASEYTAGSFSAAYVTCPNDKVAKDIARGLVEKKLAACVNIIPQITSIYEWKGKIEEDSEVLLMIKTRTSKVSALSEFVRSVHPYEVCEVISLPIEQGNPPYLKWLSDTVPEYSGLICKDKRHHETYPASLCRVCAMEFVEDFNLTFFEPLAELGDSTPDDDAMTLEQPFKPDM